MQPYLTTLVVGLAGRDADNGFAGLSKKRPLAATMPDTADIRANARLDGFKVTPLPGKKQYPHAIALNVLQLTTLKKKSLCVDSGFL